MTIQLPTQLKQKGDQFILTQVARNEHAALYSQSKAGKVHAYELVIPDHYHLKGQWQEVYPRDEEWGIRGFTIIDRDDALNRLNSVTTPLEC